MNRTVTIRRGLDIPLDGAPRQSVNPAREVGSVALLGADYVGQRLRPLVEAGTKVRIGEPVLSDRHKRDVRFVAPGTGVVEAIHRGARRMITSLVIGLEDDEARAAMFDPCTETEIATLPITALRERLLTSGLWTALRTRPYSHVPDPNTPPRSIFVTAMDTAPLAPDPRPLIEAAADAFRAGLTAVSRLTDGVTFVCAAPGNALPVPDSERVLTVHFRGPHPAGLPGTHMHLLAPVSATRIGWHVGYQDIIAIGTLFLTGELDLNRIVALAGPAVADPRLIQTRIGANLADLVRDELNAQDGARVISGCVLSGRRAGEHDGFLGRHHRQITVLREERRRRLFGWMGVLAQAPSFLGLRLGNTRARAFTTTLNGAPSAMLPLEAFERIMPLDILPSPLLRALLVGDTEAAQSLGALELDEEDLALASFVCPGKYDYGALLRSNLIQIEREG